MSGVRRAMASFAARRAARLEGQRPGAAARWLVWAARLAPTFGPVHHELIAFYRRADNRLAAVDAARLLERRFQDSADAWVLIGDAYLAAYRHREALTAFERALQIDERPDAAMRAGILYERLGDHPNAGARFARAYAAGGGADALRANAKALHQAGDAAAAAQARELWERETGEKWEEQSSEQ